MQGDGKPILVFGTDSSPYAPVDAVPQRILCAAPERRMARGVVLHGGDVLVVRQSRTGLALLPGGGIEGGEQPHEALVREMREEAGLSVASATEAVQIWEEWHGSVFVTYAFLCDGFFTGPACATEKERYLGQAATWIPVGTAYAALDRGLPELERAWRGRDGELRPDLLPVAEYLSHAHGICMREAAILRTLFPAECGIAG